MARHAFFFLVLAITIGCSQGPDIPELPNNLPEGQSILLHGDLRPGDIRTLFRQVNRNGRLDALKPYLETPSDTELEPLARLINNQLYRQLDSPDGLIAAVQATIKQHRFAHWPGSAATLVVESGYRERADLLLTLAGDPAFPALVQRDRRWLDPQWAMLLTTTWQKAQGSYQETKPHPTAAPVSAAALVADLQTLLSADDSRTAIASRFGALVDTHLIYPLARLGSDWREQIGVAPFEGLGYGLAGLVTAPPVAPGAGYANRLDQTLGFLHSLDRPTEGLFSTLADSLRRETGALSYVAEALRPVFAQVVNENLQAHLADKGKDFWLGLARPSEDKPGPSFVPFFRAARDALSDLIGRERENNAGDEFLFNLTLDFDAYALTRWAESIAASNAAAWRTWEAADFAQNVWRKPVKDETQPLDCTDGKILAATVAADFKVLQKERLAKEAANAIARGGYGDFVYPFTGGDFKMLSNAAQAALESINKGRPFVDPEPSVRLLVKEALSPDNGGKSLIERLESDNLLLSLQSLLGGIGAEGWQSVKFWLFDKLALDHLTLDARNTLAGFYKGQPALADRMSQFLDGVALIRPLDTGIDGLPSPFAFYHAVLRETDGFQKRALGSLLSYLGEAGWLGSQNGTAHLPALQAVVADGGNASRALYALSNLSAADSEAVTTGLSEMLGREGLRQHLDLLAGLLQSQPRGVEAWLSALSTMSEVPTLPPALQSWLRRFIMTPDFPLLVSYLRAHGDRAGALKLVRELRTLSRNGELREAFGLLGYLRNDRLRDLSGYLKNWLASQELDALLDTAETLLVPLVESPAARRVVSSASE